MIQAMILEAPAIDPSGLASVSERMVKGYVQLRSKSVISETTYGSIGGINFSRRIIEGMIDDQSGKLIICVMFIAVDKDRCIQLYTQDTNEHTDALELVEAALLSLKKRL